jgi:5-methylthioadenosine/S-adenosylhomocysteine deaminase
MKEMVADLLIHDGLVITVNRENQIFPEADVAVVDDRIVAIGPHLPIQAKKTVSARGKAVLPGLINAHMHETLTRGICEDLPLNRWLVEVCFPLDRSYSFEIMHAAGLMNQAEMILGGITTFMDIYRHPAACAEVAIQSGMRAILAPQIISDPPLVGETVETAEAFVSEWCKGKKSSRVMAAFGPHAPYSCNPSDLKKVADLVQKYDTLIHSHLGETVWEVNVIKERYGCSPTEYYERNGLLSGKLSAAHGVHLTSDEIHLLKERNVSIVYNPSSNMKLASGIAEVNTLQQAGITVALGTDSNLSNNNLDMWEEMRIGATLQKLSAGDASVLPSRMMLRIATIEGAKAFGLDTQIGSLEPGKKADLILVDLNKPHLWPLLDGSLNNIIDQLVYSANSADVTDSFIDGKQIMAERSLLTLDLAEIRKEVDLATKKLIKSAGLASSK